MTLLAAVLAIGARADGLVRVLDQHSRTYTVHLEVSQDGNLAVSDYEIILKRRPPAKGDKGPGSLKPATHLLYLTNLVYRSGDYTRKESSFGAGDITFGVDGLPAGVINPGWTLCPLISFYVPGAEGRVLTDNSVALDDLGGGWSLVGTARVGLANVAGQSIDLEGKLTGKNSATMSLTSHAMLDADTGWPKTAKGVVEGSSAKIVYTVSLRS